MYSPLTYVNCCYKISSTIESQAIVEYTVIIGKNKKLYAWDVGYNTYIHKIDSKSYRLNMCGGKSCMWRFHHVKWSEPGSSLDDTADAGGNIDDNHNDN